MNALKCEHKGNAQFDCFPVYIASRRHLLMFVNNAQIEDAKNGKFGKQSINRFATVERKYLQGNWGKHRTGMRGEVYHIITNKSIA